MKFNKWTIGLAAGGVVSLASAVKADTAPASSVMTALSSTTLSGYVDTSAQLNIHGQNPTSLGAPTQFGSVGAPPYTVGSAFGNGKANSINLNVVDLKLSKPQDEGQWAAGYCVELWFGPDAVGLGSTFDGNGDSQSTAIRQAYISLRTPVGNGIDWKIGVFDTIIGYESLTSASNPNYTHSYGFVMEPTTHTGVLASYRINDMISLTAGVADTSYTGGGYTASINNGVSNPTLMGALSLTAPDSWGWIKGGTLYLGAINTPSSTGTGATSFYGGATIPTPMNNLKFGASFDYLDQHNKDFGALHNDSIWDAALYASFQATEKLSLNLRGEYLDNSGADSFFGASTFSIYNADKAEEITATAQYNLWANVISRVEFRWDHVEHGRPFSTSGNSFRTFSSAYLFAAQLIYQF